jgi:hypothetical protein
MALLSQKIALSDASICWSGGVPLYSFFLINHLGEPFEASERSFDTDQEACDHAQALAERGYPVEVKSGGERIKLIPLMTWSVEDWLSPPPRHSTPPFSVLRRLLPHRAGPAACPRCHGPMPRKAGAAGERYCEACL